MIYFILYIINYILFIIYYLLYIFYILYIYIYILYIIEGSLEVKLPTIWRDEKQSREEA